MLVISWLPALLLVAIASAQKGKSKSSGVAVWSQCGGSSFTGPTACVSGNYCKIGNPWYSQCIPGNADEPLDFIPDVPIETQSRQTIITIGGDGDTPLTIVTTAITYLTPRPTATQGRPPEVTTIDGTRYTIVPDVPLTPKRREVVTGQATATPTPFERLRRRSAWKGARASRGL